MFLGSKRATDRICAKVAESIDSCALHPAVMAFVLGNEIQHQSFAGHLRRVEQFLKRLYEVAKQRNGAALVTYPNYPSTEYLRLPFLDFVAFNILLESRPEFAAISVQAA